MDAIISIQKAVDYIEDNLTERLDYGVIASQACMSSYHFQRLFAILCSYTVGEYIRNRRLTLAGYEVLSTDTKIIDIALKYGYETPESFARAFTRFHGKSPLMARNEGSTLKSFARLSIKSVLKEESTMQELCKRGYVVKENGSVYYTMDMDKTMKWFREILGWYGEIDARNADGIGTYGCICAIPQELVALHIAPFTGIHLFYGEPQKNMVAFMMVEGIDELYTFIRKSGWNQITEVTQASWGSKICRVTTIDGSILCFFE